MPFVSVTRLHLASKLYLIPFTIYALLSARQAKRSRGFRGGALARDADGGQWTVTSWDKEDDMRDFRNAGAHRAVMPKLLRWCNEASFAHYTTDSTALPDEDEAYRRLQAGGKTSKVRAPSAAHAAGQTVSASPPRVSLSLRPTGTVAS